MSFQFTIDPHLSVRSPNFPHGHFAGGLDLESLCTNIPMNQVIHIYINELFTKTATIEKLL